VTPNLANIKRIVQDLEKGLYESFHLNFVEPLPRALLEELAAAVARDGSGELVNQVCICTSISICMCLIKLV
jgi:sec1 family domain-containing protein 1